MRFSPSPQGLVGEVGSDGQTDGPVYSRDGTGRTARELGGEGTVGGRLQYLLRPV